MLVMYMYVDLDLTQDCCHVQLVISNVYNVMYTRLGCGPKRARRRMTTRIASRTPHTTISAGENALYHSLRGYILVM